MKTIKSKILLSILLVFILSAVSVPVWAAENTGIDWTRTGTVSITLRDGNTAISGAEITLYKVAIAESVKSNLNFTYTDSFQDFGGIPNDIKDKETVLRLADYVRVQNISGIGEKTDENGCVRFDDLSLGLYLVVQTGSVQGYSACTPFVVSIPVGEEGEWVYDIDATPKTDIVRLVDITVKKVWNDDGKNRPESVTVQLYKGDTAVDTVTLNEQNGWRYTWNDQPQGDSWKVEEINVPKGYIVTYEQKNFTYTVTNTAGLIQTGQLKWPIPVLAGAGLLLFAGGWILFYTRKKKRA